jgi:hypothetical protein
MNFLLFSTSKTFINQTVSTTYPTKGYHETTGESFPRKKKKEQLTDSRIERK